MTVTRMTLTLTSISPRHGVCDAVVQMLEILKVLKVLKVLEVVVVVMVVSLKLGVPGGGSCSWVLCVGGVGVVLRCRVLEVGEGRVELHLVLVHHRHGL